MPIRIRLAVVFAAGTAAVFIVASIVFVHLLADGLRSSLDSGIQARADLIAQSLPTASAGSVGLSPNLAVRGQGDGIAQILDAAGRIVASSSGAGSDALLSQARLQQARRTPVWVTTTFSDVGPTSLGGEHTRILATPVLHAGQTWIVVVGSSLEASDQATTRVRNAAVIAGPPAVLLAALAAWFLASAALRPVERMRRQAAEISEHDTNTSIEVPATRDEIAALAQTMNGLLGRLQAALARERGFVADAGHELRTPLAILRTELELASRPGRTLHELTQAVAAAADETDRLARLAEDLLSLARTDEGPAQLQRGPTDVGHLLNETVNRAKLRADQLGVSLELEVEPGLIVDVDGDRISRAVANLVDNALQHAPRASAIRVSAAAPAAELIIEVADAGPGFAPSLLPHAFERFRRSDAARARGDGGAGLGLAIVRSIVVAHGGRATASNPPTGGAMVRLELPLSAEASID
jgi:two-component system OmpR family sensor kinase